MICHDKCMIGSCMTRCMLEFMMDEWLGMIDAMLSA